MKSILLFLLLALTAQFINAQSIGIGTTTPNPKALLDINSTTKGILIPSMTTSQRFAITTPPGGLMVYDTDKNEFYHYNGSGWTAILNGGYWTRPITSRNRITNNSDSVGIGTNSPGEWLDVNGNIRSRNNLMADNNVTAAGAVSGAGLISTGNAVVNGTSVLNGDVKTNSNLNVIGTSLLNGDVTTTSDLIIDNPTATFQLKSSGANKGYYQLSGNNVRFGTNSGNSTGNVIVRLNGNDRVQINPGGDIDLDGKITRTASTGAINMLPLCFGRVATDGSITSGSGNFTVAKISIGVGNYEITCTGITANVVCMATSEYNTDNMGIFYKSANTVKVFCRNLSTNALNDTNFSFVIYAAQ